MISLIETEQQIIQWQIQYSPQIAQNEKGGNLTLKWSGTSADLIELAYGILETKRLNNGDIDINSLTSQLSIIFSFEIKDCYDTFRAIRRRVGSRTLFLDEMIEKLNQRMEDMDNGIFKKKKVR